MRQPFFQEQDSWLYHVQLAIYTKDYLDHSLLNLDEALPSHPPRKLNCIYFSSIIGNKLYNENFDLKDLFEMSTLLNLRMNGTQKGRKF